jgi:hypothetical protein
MSVPGWPGKIGRRRPPTTLRSSAVPGARRPAGGSPMPDSGGGRQGSSGTAVCLLWPSGTRSWVTRARCQPPRRPAGSWERGVWRWVGLPRRIPFVRWTRWLPRARTEQAFLGLRPQGTGGSHGGGFPAERRINRTIMQTDPTACHSPISVDCQPPSIPDRRAPSTQVACRSVEMSSVALPAPSAPRVSSPPAALSIPR